MSQIANVEINSWGIGGYIVAGTFRDLQIISARSFTNYGDALKEMQRQILREVLRYETGNNSDFNRKPYRD